MNARTNLGDVLATSESPVKLMRHQQSRPEVDPDVLAEYTNRLREQWGPRHSCVLFNQSHPVASEPIGRRSCGTTR